MKQKILLFFLVMLAPLSVSAEIYADIDGISYSLNSADGRNYAWVYGATNSNVTTVTIPETVTCENVTYTVEYIRKEAFNGLEKLKTISIPRTMKQIGTDAFKNCEALTALYITDVVAWCKVLFESWHSSPMVYAHQLFLNGEKVTDLVIPEGVTSIGEFAFLGCSLNSVTIPTTLKTLGPWALCCTDMTAVHISDLRAWCDIQFGAESNPLINANHLFLNGEEVKELEYPKGFVSVNESFHGCTGLTSVTLPSSVTSIGSFAFMGCTNLTTVTLPYNLSTINSMAFAECSQLQDVYCYAEKVPSISNNTFSDSNIKNATLHVPEASVDTYKASAYWKDFKNIVALTIEPTPMIAIDETNFPDENFRAWLLSQSYGVDGQLAENELENITILNVSNKGIKRLKGIEYFTAVTEINCSQNEIKGKNMDELVACLPTVTAGFLNVKHYSNEQNVMDTEQVAAAKAKGWTPRYNIQPNYWTWYEYRGSEPIDDSPVVVTREQVGYVGFWGWVWSQDFGTDGQLTEKEISKVQRIYVPNRYFANLDGIGYFTALTELICNDNYISTIDLSKNTALTKLVCYNNVINGKGAETFVANLPTVTEGVIQFTMGSYDDNSMTPALVALAKAKGWTVLYHDSDLWEWIEYGGSTDGIGDVNNGKIKMKDAGVYDIGGRQLPQLRRGVNIVRKVDGTTQKVQVK